jgi:Leucine-rich repeat (LRR) protein
MIYQQSTPRGPLSPEDNPASAASHPDPSGRRAWLLRRIYPSTWLAMLLAAGVMFLVEFPGHHRGTPFLPNTFQHGWPLVWIEGRESGSSQQTAASPLIDEAGVVVQTYDSHRGTDPWRLGDDIQLFDPVSFAGDMGVSLLIVALAGWLFQIWRRRHRRLLRFRLRTLLGFVALVAFLIAPFARLHREQQREGEALEQLKSESISGLAVRTWYSRDGNDDLVTNQQRVAGIEVFTERFPPPWMPEWLAHADVLHSSIDRVSWVHIHGDRFTEASLGPLAELSHLEGLEIAQGDVTDEGFQSLAGLTSLRDLRLSQAQVTDRRLEQLSALSRLNSLTLEKSEVTDAGLSAVARLRNLRSFEIASGKLHGDGLAQLAGLPLNSLVVEAEHFDDAGIAAIGKLPHLYYLELRKTPLRSLRLRGLDGLSALDLSGNSSLIAVDLRELHGLYQLRINSGAERRGKAAQPNVQLGGANRLIDLSLDGAALGPNELNVRRGNLGFIDLNHVQFLGSPSLDMSNQPGLRSLSVGSSNVAAICMADDPNLHYIKFFRNSQLTTFRLERLSELEEVSLSGSSRLAASDLLKDLAGVSSLRHLALNDVSLSGRDMVALGSLTKLETLDLSRCNIADESLDQLKNLAALKTLLLSQTPLSDEAVAAFQQSHPLLTIVDFESKKSAVSDLRRQAARVRNRLSREIVCNVDPAKLRDEDFACLADVDSLETLDLSQTHLTDAGLKHLLRLSKLKSLAVRRTNLTDAAVRTLQQLPALIHLNIDGTLITVEGRRGLGPIVTTPGEN